MSTVDESIRQYLQFVLDPTAPGASVTVGERATGRLRVCVTVPDSTDPRQIMRNGRAVNVARLACQLLCDIHGLTADFETTGTRR